MQENELGAAACRSHRGGQAQAGFAIALQVFDGKGNVRQVDAVADNGFLTPGWRPGTGSYSVNPDCTGTETLVVPGMGDLHLQIIVAQGGNTIHQVVIDPGIATTAEGERIKAPQQ